MPGEFYKMFSAFQSAADELKRFDTATSELLPDPGTDLYVEGAALEEQVRILFAALAATEPANLHEASLLQRAILTQIGYFVRDHEPDAHKAMTHLGAFLERLAAEKNSS